MICWQDAVVDRLMVFQCNTAVCRPFIAGKVVRGKRTVCTEKLLWCFI